jgi:hypothetical protein
VLSKAVKASTPKAVPAAHHKAKKDPTMSAAQAALIVTMRAAVDKRLDDMGHTCTQPVPNPNLRCVFVLHFVFNHTFRILASK